jgi:hypothetical protein
LDLSSRYTALYFEISNVFFAETTQSVSLFYIFVAKLFLSPVKIAHNCQTSSPSFTHASFSG